jgi:hypothetical protein
VLLLGVMGCGGGSAESDLGVVRTASAVTNAFGVAALSYERRDGSVSRSESITAVDAENPAEALDDVALLGLTDGSYSLYLAVDPNVTFPHHPVIGAGSSLTSRTRTLEMSPVIVRDAPVVTQQDAPGGLLYRLSRDYGSSSTTTVGSLGTRLSTLAQGRMGALVVCTFQPLTSSAGKRVVTEVAVRGQTGSGLRTALETHDWVSLFGDIGFSTTSGLSVRTLSAASLPSSFAGRNELDDTAIIIVEPSAYAPPTPPPSSETSLRLELTWDRAVDLDLHLVRKDGTGAYTMYNRYNDCFWQHPEQEWGSASSREDNPRLIQSSLDGSLAEIITMNRITDLEDYAVGVDYWGDPQGYPVNRAVTATVRLYLNGVLQNTYTTSNLYHGEPERGDMQTVAYIHGARGLTREPGDTPIARSPFGGLKK